MCTSWNPHFRITPPQTGECYNKLVSTPPMLIDIVRGGMYLDSQNMINSVTSSVFEGNYAAIGGGAICLKDSNYMFDVTSSIFRQNFAGSYGGAVSLRSSNQAVTISDSSLVGNTADLAGGGLHSAMSNNNFVLQSSYLFGNKAPVGGGAFWGEDHVNVTVVDCVMSSNRAQEGGALYASQFISHFIVSNCLFFSNRAFRGGGLVLLADNSAVTATNFTLNMASEDGGGVIIQADYVEIASCLFTNNSASKAGGGLYVEYSNDINIGFSTWSNGYALTGSGISILDSQYILTESCHYYSNTARTGGTVWLVRTQNVTMKSDAFVNNTGNVGGALYCTTVSGLDIIGNQFINNLASISGGGVYMVDTDSSTFRASEFLDNTAMSYSGSALWILASQMFTSECTFGGNRAPNGGGTVYWQVSSGMSEPVGILNSTFHDTNVALYGPKVATEGTHTTIAQGSDISISDYTNPVPTFSALLNDYYGQIVATESNAVVKISVPAGDFKDGSCFDGPGYITGGTVETMVGGVANFSALEAYCAPGYSMLLNSTCDISTATTGTLTVGAPIRVHFRECVRGEVYSSKICRACSNGKYTKFSTANITLCAIAMRQGRTRWPMSVTCPPLAAKSVPPVRRSVGWTRSGWRGDIGALTASPPQCWIAHLEPGAARAGGALEASSAQRVMRDHCVQCAVMDITTVPPPAYVCDVLTLDGRILCWCVL